MFLPFMGVTAISVLCTQPLGALKEHLVGPVAFEGVCKIVKI